MSSGSNFYERVAGDAGKRLDEGMLAWRRKGINGNEEEREDFLKQCFFGARFNMRMVLIAAPTIAPGKTSREILNDLVPKVIESVTQQARESGFTEEQTRIYVDAHQKAYDSLYEELGTA